MAVQDGLIATPCRKLAKTTYLARAEATNAIGTAALEHYAADDATVKPATRAAEPTAGSEETEHVCVVKDEVGHYPTLLHARLASLGLAPRLWYSKPHAGRMLLVMGKVDGETVLAWLTATTERAQWNHVEAIVTEAAEKKLHACGLVHGDLRVTNVMILNTDRCSLSCSDDGRRRRPVIVGDVMALTVDDVCFVDLENGGDADRATVRFTPEPSLYPSGYFKDAVITTALDMKVLRTSIANECKTRPWAEAAPVGADRRA